MPDTKDGQKRITSLEMNYIAMQAEIKSMNEKLDQVCKKQDDLLGKFDQFRMGEHDNSRDIADLKLELAKSQLTIEAQRKFAEKTADALAKMRYYIAGAAGVISFAIYILDRFILK